MTLSGPSAEGRAPRLGQAIFCSFELFFFGSFERFLVLFELFLGSFELYRATDSKTITIKLKTVRIAVFKFTKTITENKILFT